LQWVDRPKTWQQRYCGSAECQPSHKERNGYEVVPGLHKHLMLSHASSADVLLPLRPTDNPNYAAVKHMPAALAIETDKLVRSGRLSAHTLKPRRFESDIMRIRCSLIVRHRLHAQPTAHDSTRFPGEASEVENQHLP